MSRFVEGQDRSQMAQVPECLDDFIAEDNPIRVVDAFVQELDLSALGFKGTMPAGERPKPGATQASGQRSVKGSPSEGALGLGHSPWSSSPIGRRCRSGCRNTWA